MSVNLILDMEILDIFPNILDIFNYDNASSNNNVGDCNLIFSQIVSYYRWKSIDLYWILYNVTNFAEIIIFYAYEE